MPSQPPALSKQTRPRLNRQFFRDVWVLAKPYWMSEERKLAWSLLIGIIGLNLFQVYLNVRMNIWFGDFYGALQRYDRHGVLVQFGVFALIAGIFVLTAVVAAYLQLMLQIRWRRWMTQRFASLWMAGKAYYRLQVIAADADNPDQRIQEDVRDFPSQVLDLTLGLMTSVVTLFSFLGMLWVLGGTLRIPLGAHVLAIPGYGVWASLIYSVLGTWIAVRIGRPLVGLNFQQQRYEADFRYSMARLRENAESVAFFNGEKPELGTFKSRFGSVVTNYLGLMRVRKNFGFFRFGFAQTSILVSFGLPLPAYFAKTIDFGGYQQFIMAFGQVQSALSYIVDNYSAISDETSSIARFQSIVLRLSGFAARLDQAVAQGTGERLNFETAKDGFNVAGLQVALPNGQPLLDDISFDLRPGERALLTGPSGIGKSTMLRALARLWPFSSGTVRSGFRKPLFLPQRPYLPIGSLRDAVLYPHGDRATPDADIASALVRAGLAQLAEEMDKEEDWSLRLSLGEQQRLSFARVLIQRPDGLFLDEATSALDELAEERLYGLLREMTDPPAVFSIGHRATLRGYHDRKLELQPGEHGAVLAEDAA